MNKSTLNLINHGLHVAILLDGNGRWAATRGLARSEGPRAGVEAEALAHLKKLAPPRIHYVSCDPATLGRDLAQLVGTKDAAGPYEIESINLFDIFPQTYHMEVLVRLRRRA